MFRTNIDRCRNVKSGFRSVVSQRTSREAQESLEVTRNAEGKCVAGSRTIAAFDLVGQGWTNNGTVFTGYPIIGYQNNIQTSGTCQYAPYDNGLGYACAWDYRPKEHTFFFESGFAIDFTHIHDFVADVKALVTNDPTSLCGLSLYTGILMRFVKKYSEVYLGEVSPAALDLDITFYRASSPKMPRLNEDTLEEIEQLVIFKYGGKPHWGKNRPIAFLTTEKVYPDLPKFLKVKERYDPQALFSNEWTDAVLNISGAATALNAPAPYCALEGLCICSEDVHCAPEAFYFCRAGIVYKEARVCRFIGPTL